MIEGFVLLIGILVFTLTPLCVAVGRADVSADIPFTLSLVWFFGWYLYFGFNYEFIFTIGLK